jgi:subtilisin family serine protease
MTTATLGQASTVAVVDSGTDDRHEVFQGRMWNNPGEGLKSNYLDDDFNGKIDDLIGWNFIDGFGEVFFPEQQIALPNEIYRVLEILAKIELGRLNQADKDYWNALISSTNDKQKNELMKVLNNFGNYAHGTHTSGIVVQQAPQARIMSLRTIPDVPYDIPTLFENRGGPRGLDDLIYQAVAQILNQNFQGISHYLNEHQVDVSNYSLGTPLVHLARMVLSVTGKKDPTKEQLIEVTGKMYAQLAQSGEEWAQLASDTLLVFASGNDGLNNDEIHAFPANMDFAHTITVGASIGTKGITAFSNYGKQTVHVLAPGSAIVSAVPHDSRVRYLPFSGTSMAAPYVSGLAASLKDINPALSAADLKQVLMATVDVKAQLQELVVTSGIVNGERAKKAASYSLTLPLQEAIDQARIEVADQLELEPSYGLDEMNAIGAPNVIRESPESTAWMAFIQDFKL